MDRIHHPLLSITTISKKILTSITHFYIKTIQTSEKQLACYNIVLA